VADRKVEPTLASTGKGKGREEEKHVEKEKKVKATGKLDFSRAKPKEATVKKEVKDEVQPTVLAELLELKGKATVNTKETKRETNMKKPEKPDSKATTAERTPSDQVRL
jgi:hypothetical protein